MDGNSLVKDADVESVPPYALIVDDDPGILGLLAIVLAKEGFEVASAPNGIRALDLYAERVPDLILLDARMPVLDGFATCERIRTVHSGVTLPVLMITAFDDPQSVEQAFAAGANDVLFKPINFALLRARVRSLLQASRHAREIHAREEYLRALVEHTDDIIAVINADLTVRYASPAQQRHLGYPSDAGGDTIFDAIHPEDHVQLQNVIGRMRGVPGHVVTTTIRVRHANGSWRIFEITATNLVRDPAVRGIVVNCHDITERKQAEEQLIHSAFHDPLTGLSNRALFLNRLGQAVDRGVRTPEYCYAVLFLDLDRFKTVNDSLGHQVGDYMLIEVARRLERGVRPGDTIARIGGDEFAILVDNLKTEHEAVVVAERILAAFATPFLLEGHEIASSASIGIAMSKHGTIQSNDLLRDADIAMYSAKRSGPGRYSIADPNMYAQIQAQRQLETELRRAVEREEFVLHYQPKVTIDGRRIQGVEALIRWQHPERGLLSPAEFIPLAEETGLIVPIGTWVLRVACGQIRAWTDTGLPPLLVAVNLSAHQLQQPAIAAMIRDILSETGADPQHLCLELTESMLMEDVETAVAVLHELRDMHIGALTIDDFGTGYSSLNYLLRFPVTMIKIDRSFVRDITTNPSSATLATAIIALAQSLELKTIAEGVETEEQRAFLEHAGCTYFQGFLLSRPLPIDEVEPLLWAYSSTNTA